METLQYLISLFLELDEHLAAIIQEYGVWTYGLLFLIILCETGLVVTPLLPGDSLLFAAGAFASKGALSLPLLLVLLTVAAIAGDSMNYAVGQFLGPRLIAMKRFRLIKPEHLQKTHEFFERYGGKTIIIARFVPIVRTFAPFVAGLGSMTYRRFMSYNVIGGTAWVLICTVSGYLLASNAFMEEHFELMLLAIIGVSVLPGVIEILRARFRRTPAPSTPGE